MPAGNTTENLNAMAITELRILPPLAIARLGSSRTPLEAYELEPCDKAPLDFRKIVGRETLEVDENTGVITR